MPKSCYDFVKWEEFKTGFSCGGKLTFKHVKGGVILVETDFTIKEEKTISNIVKFDKQWYNKIKFKMNTKERGINMDFLYSLINNDGVKLLIIVIVLDTIFGILRAIKEKSLNSCIGIDGIIRKTGMLISIIFLALIDSIVNIDLIGFIPENVKNVLQFGKVGISDIFNLLFIIFEILSIFKNMILCKLPIPKKLQEFLENAMKEMTGEIKEKGE